MMRSKHAIYEIQMRKRDLLSWKKKLRNLKLQDYLKNYLLAEGIQDMRYPVSDREIELIILNAKDCKRKKLLHMLEQELYIETMSSFLK